MNNKGYIEQAWGYELAWATTEKYCGKIMCFNSPGCKTSFHFHKEKDSSLFVNSGQFILRFIDLSTGELKERIIKEGDAWRIAELVPHQIEALTPNAVMLEVGTADIENDEFKILPTQPLS